MSRDLSVSERMVGLTIVDVETGWDNVIEALVLDDGTRVELGGNGDRAYVTEITSARERDRRA